MIYLDTSVALAHRLAEDRQPPGDVVDAAAGLQPSPRMGAVDQVHARGFAGSHAELVRALLARLAILELSPTVLVRASEPFAVPVRTLDALHITPAEFLRK